MSQIDAIINISNGAAWWIVATVIGAASTTNYPNTLGLHIFLQLKTVKLINSFYYNSLSPLFLNWIIIGVPLKSIFALILFSKYL